MLLHVDLISIRQLIGLSRLGAKLLKKQLLCGETFALDILKNMTFIGELMFQVDCPEDCATYIHRVGRTARYLSGGKSLLFVMPSEMKMLEKLREKKIPLQVTKVLFNLFDLFIRSCY